jgi:hypothetical protein
VRLRTIAGLFDRGEQADVDGPVQGRDGHVPGAGARLRRGRDARAARPRRHPRRGRQRLEDRASELAIVLPAARRRQAAVGPAAAHGAGGRDPRILDRHADRDLGPRDRQDRRQRHDGAGQQHAGDVAARRHAYSETAQKVAKGEVKNDTAFAFVARVDKKDRETVFENEACWGKSLPALGITYPITNIREAVQTARRRLSTASSVKRLYFGIPTGAADFWINEEDWAAVLGVVDEEALRGCRCWLSLDLSKKNDLTALTATWLDDDGRLWQKTWYWTTKDGLEDRSRQGRPGAL